MSTNTLLLGLVLAGLATPGLSQTDHPHMIDHGHGDADPLLTKVMLDQLEAGEESDRLAAQVWIGKDLHKLWLKAEVERDGAETDNAELQALYSRAISPYWDLQLGLRHDQRPEPTRDWGVLGLQGLAPYFFTVEAAVFVGEQGRSAARLKGEYELLFTQKLILSPELELNLYGQDDPATATGSGLANSDAGLRLRYELWREFAPYVGISWQKRYGATADLNRARGEAASDHQWVIGLRAWF